MHGKLTERTGDWIQTYTGMQFWPVDPRPEEINIEDIAHALSMQCRYAGHCIRFYSVAEHSVLLARHFREDSVHMRLWALLHDASEAYLTDVPRPLKPFLPGYKEAESAVMAAVVARFNMLPFQMPAEVKRADGCILADEATQNMAEPPTAWNFTGDPLGISLQYWSPLEAKAAFLSEFESITDARRAALKMEGQSDE